jgi:O-antigen/teichoic acid export membrane protein
VSLGIALLGSLVLWLLSYRLSGENLRVLTLAFWALPLWTLLNLYEASLRGLGRILAGQLVSTVVRPLSFLILIGAVWLSIGEITDASSVLGLHILAAGTALASASYLLRRQLISFTPPNSLRQNATVWGRSALSLAFLALLNMIPQHVGTILLGWMRSPNEAGLYKVAYQAASLVPFGLIVVNTAIAPTLAQLYIIKDATRLYKLMFVASTVSTAFALPLVLLFTLRGRWFLGSTYGEAFTGGATALAIIALSQFINAATGPVGLILIMSGHENKAVFSVSISSAVNLVCNIAFVRLWALNGVAAAFAVSLIVKLSINTYFALQVLRPRPTLSGGVT